MPKSGANPTCSPRNDEWRQWADAVVRKAAPKIVRSLIEAAESLDEFSQTPQGGPPSHSIEAREDESLAALLLRLLRTGENGGTENVAARAATTISENPSVG